MIMLTVATCVMVSQADDEAFQTLRILDNHTAGMLPRGYFGLDCRTYPDGYAATNATPGSGVTMSLIAGLTDKLNIAIGYGGDGLIGRDTPRFNPHIGAMFKYRIIEESYSWPAVAIGYDHQGFGGIDESYNGYMYKSPGFFIAFSKNYLVFTKLQLGLHGGITYSLEDYDNIKWPNGYIGTDIALNEDITLATEYDLALNAADWGYDTLHYYNPLRGYLGIAARWNISKSLNVEFAFKDLLESKIDVTGHRVGWGRELRLTYIGKLF